MTISAIILSAGAGSRMQSDLPKVLLPIAGKAMLLRVIEQALQLSLQEVMVVVGHQHQKVIDAIADYPVNTVIQQHQLGTGHAVSVALSKLKPCDNVLVLSADVPNITADTLKPLLQQDKAAIKILSCLCPQPKGYGRLLRDADNNVTAIVEEKDATAEQKQIKEINSGVYVFPYQFLQDNITRLNSDNNSQEYYLTDLLSKAFATNVRTIAFVADYAELSGVNTMAQLIAAERVFQRRQADLLLEEGVKILAPERFDLRGSLKCGNNVVIDVNCVIEGEVSLGDNVTIGPNCVLKDCSIGRDSQIKAFSMVEKSTLADNCVIGPYARLRPGNTLSSNVKIGNFVEVKASNFAAGVKASHLSYLGDADIGADCNIGAGTITCNYDGKQKYKTKIGSNVFVGSNCELIAPIKIGDFATIAAGTTATKDVATSALLLNDKPQKQIKNWQVSKVTEG